MGNENLGYTSKFSGMGFDAVIDRTTEALKSQGFGVITEIDVKATMRKKLDVDFRNYQILGACNPGFAHKALSQDLAVGLLLPCNAVVYEEDDGDVVVSFVKPSEMFKVMAAPELAGLADEVDESIRQVHLRLQEFGATAG